MTETDFRLMQERMDALQTRLTVVEAYIQTQLYQKYYGREVVLNTAGPATIPIMESK